MDYESNLIKLLDDYITETCIKHKVLFIKESTLGFYQESAAEHVIALNTTSSTQKGKNQWDGHLKSCSNLKTAFLPQI